MMKADPKTEAAVLAVIDKFTESYRNRDVDGLMALVAPDDDTFLFGTGADEKPTGPDEFRHQAERDWSQREASDFQLSWGQVSAAGPVAWVAGVGTYQGPIGGQEIGSPLRLTAVLENRGDQWLMVQSHLSLPASDQEDGDSVPV
jgi:ketosteroid isomerase-like protein